MENNVRITTIDNPYNPFTDYDNWLNFDIEKGYYTCNKLARLSNITHCDSNVDEITLITIPLYNLTG